MRVDKSNPRHWLYLALFGLNTLVAIALRPFARSKGNKSLPRQIILYGHRLSGNLLALYRYISKHSSDEFELTFLTMDPDYYQNLRNEGFSSCKATSISAIRLMCTADAVISDHGLHSMLPLLWLSNVKFFDVWHGIPFKGFDENDFTLQHRYTETWVASPLLAELYEETFGFAREKICVTGYARTDDLVTPHETDEQIRKRFGLAHTNGKKLVLFAPTWKQDAIDRTLFPFGIDPDTFIKDINDLCRECHAVPLLRTHFNAQLPGNLSIREFELVPFSQFPDTEALLQITDILICDWSSIAFDFLVLNRSTIFLDVAPPFAKGFSLGPEFRFDRIATKHADLLQALKEALTHSPDSEEDQRGRRSKIRKKVFGEFIDGRSSSRCAARLRSHLLKCGSSQ